MHTLTTMYVCVLFMYILGDIMLVTIEEKNSSTSTMESANGPSCLLTDVQTNRR